MKPIGPPGVPPPDDFEDIARRIAEVLAGTGVASCEMTLTMSDGSSKSDTLAVVEDVEDLIEDRAPDGPGLWDGAIAIFQLSPWKRGNSHE